MSRLANQRRLRVAESFAPAQPWRRSLRRVRARGVLDDPLGQGLIALTSAVLTAGGGLWLLLLGRDLAAGLMFGVAAVEMTVYVALAARAFKRDKAVQFWQERRQLRFDLDREEAFRRLMLQALSQVNHHAEMPTESQIQNTLDRMVDLTFRVFSSAHDDLAVLLVRQVNGRCNITYSALSQGSRWHALSAGKHCILDGDLEDRLRELAPHHRAHLISSSTTPLWLVVLHDSPLSKREAEMLHRLPSAFEAVANQRTSGPAYRPLRVAS